MTEIKRVHAGFDGLDLSYCGLIPATLLSTLSKAKTEAALRRSPVLVTYRGVDLLVQESGARGYAFRVDTGEMGATWFFRETERREAGNIRVSAKSLPLAINGLCATKEYFDEFLRSLAIAFDPFDARIARADFAVDVLAPKFELRPENIVCHSRKKIQEFREAEVHGVSGRLTGVQIGKMPGEQVVIYDKRLEIIERRKAYWWDIWAKNIGYALSRDERVWRAELRVGRDALEKALKLRSWRNFVDVAPRLFADIASTTRLTIPHGVNRSRWADDPLWREVREAVARIAIVSDIECMPTAKLAELANERRNLLFSQFVGLAKSLAVADGISFTDYPSYLQSLFAQLLDEVRSEEGRVGEEFERKAAELSVRFAQG